MNTKMVLACCALTFGAGTASAANAPRHVAKPKQDVVPDAKTATRIAVAVWEPIYGDKQIAKQKPYRAVLANGIWTVKGTMQGHGVGGVALAKIAKEDGKIVRVSHGK
jgi:hypothetical protein